MKLVGNLIVALEMEALAEGLVLAHKAGLDLKTVMEVVKVADFRSPLLVSNGQNVLKRDFSTSFALKLMLKDAGPDREICGKSAVTHPGSARCRKESEVGRCAWLRKRKRLRRNQGA